MSLTRVSNAMQSSAPISVLDYAGLAVVTACRSPGDPASHLLTSFLNWTPAIQAALDACYAAGGGSVVLPKNTVPYYVQDQIEVKANTTFVCEDWLILADYNYTGATLGASGDNIVLENLMIDNSNIYAGGSGYNGIGAAGKNIKVFGGIIKNCRSGNNDDGTGDGGKGVQIEPGGGEDVVIDGLTFSNCFMAMSTIRDFGTVDPYYGIVYSNITADNCKILFFVRQANGSQSQTGLQHSVQLNNFYAVNCGTFEGVLQFSRASNVMVSNGIVVVDPAYSAQPLIRGNHANCTFDNVNWYGDTGTCISLDPSTYAVDSSQPNENNKYDINIWGQVDTFADASISTSYRTLNGCVGNVTFRLPPAKAFFGYELRNGSSIISMSCNTGPIGNSKFVQADTRYQSLNSNFPFTFEGFEYGAFNQQMYASAAPTTGTHFQGKLVYNQSAAAAGYVGWVCTTAGTFGTYAEGLTVTADGTTTVTLSGANTELQAGMYLTINSVSAGKIIGITGTTMIMSATVPAGSGLSITYTTPVFKTFGAISA